MASIPWTGNAPAPAVFRARARPGDWTAYCIFAALTAAFALLAWPLWLGQTYVHDDALAFHLPLRAHYAACLNDGVAFDWMPQLFCGWYVTGEGQLGGYHPLHWLLYRLLPVQTGFAVEVVLNYSFCWAGLYALLRRRGLSVSASALGGGCFALGSFNLLHLAHVNGVAVVAHLPWLLYALDALPRATGRRRVRIIAVIGLLTGSQCLLGYPQYLLFTLAAEIAWLAGAQLQRLGWKDWATWLAGRFAGLLLGAVQLWPTLETLAQSTRADAGPEFALSGSLHPLNLLQLVAPYLTATRVWGENTHELGLYLGAGPLVLLLAGLARGRSAGDSHHRLYWWGAAVAGAALVYALGGYGGIYPLQARLPVLRSLRFPCRAIVLLQFGAALATAVAFERWRLQAVSAAEDNAQGAYPRKRAPIAWSIAAVSSIVALAGSQLAVGAPLSPWYWVALGPCLFFLAAVLCERGACERRWAPAVLAVFCLTELAGYGLSYSVWGHCDSVIPSVAEVHSAASTRVLIDLPGASPRSGNAAVLQGLSLADGYAGLEPRRAVELNTHAALQSACVERVQRTAQSESMVGLEPYDANWMAVPRPLPYVRVVTDVCSSDDPRADIQSLNLQRTALVAGPAPALQGKPGTVALDERAAGRIRLTAEGGVPQLLVVAESFHPGWCVRIDGALREVLRVNGDFLGALLPAGTHQIEFCFEPQSLTLTRAVSAGALSCLLLGLLISVVFPRFGSSKS